MCLFVWVFFCACSWSTVCAADNRQTSVCAFWSQLWALVADSLMMSSSPLRRRPGQQGSIKIQLLPFTCCSRNCYYYGCAILYSFPPLCAVLKYSSPIISTNVITKPVSGWKRILLSDFHVRQSRVSEHFHESLRGAHSHRGRHCWHLLLIWVIILAFI